jgi:undecaprenyl diphosphate synthase
VGVFVEFDYSFDSELYFCETYWPDFGEEDLQDAILSYQSRQRRFGKTEEQVESAQSDK